jgi:hypothetical protein
VVETGNGKLGSIGKWKGSGGLLKPMLLNKTAEENLDWKGYLLGEG